MRKTKIICTLGPSTDKGDVLRDLIANGMNVARFNFSHGSYEEHGGRLAKLKALREELGKPVAALLDTKGPEIRLKEFKNGVEMLEAGQTFTLTTREVEGTKEICSVTYKDLPQDVQPGGTIMLDDGLIMLHIEQVTDTDIICTVLNSGKIKTKKGVNVPGVHLSMPYLSQKDREDIIFGVQNGFDFIAASFVRTAQDVYDIRNLLNEYDSNIRIIAKIENREGVNNIDSILSAADAVMVARGDLGVECPLPHLPALQKRIISACNKASKPVIVATQMLLSMVNSPAPTRAETTDVANAVLDGADCVMLSEETAMGNFPVETVRYMRRITDETVASGMARPMIVVMPDASGEGPKRTGRHMGYFDVPGWDYERFFFEEFMPAVEKRYRIASDKAHRAVVGLSMGGGGTAVYALRHPELFGSACSMSGLLDMFPGRRSYDNAFQQSVADNSPVALLRGMTAEQLDGVRSVRWWVDCGDDDFLWKCNVDFYTLMRERDIPLQYRMRDGGHTWRYWQTVLPDALTFVSNGFGK